MGLADIAGKITGKDDAEITLESEGTDDSGDFRDPPPQRPEGKTRGTAPPPPKVSAAKRKQIEGEISDLLELMATGWAVRCPVCADALDESRADAAKHAATIICRNPRWVAWFELDGFSSFMTWSGLAIAFKPVAAAMWEHRSGAHAHQDDGGDDIGGYSAPPLG